MGRGRAEGTIQSLEISTGCDRRWPMSPESVRRESHLSSQAWSQGDGCGWLMAELTGWMVEPQFSSSFTITQSLVQCLSGPSLILAFKSRYFRLSSVSMREKKAIHVD